MVKEHVSALHGIEDVWRRRRLNLRKFTVGLGNERCVLQIVAIEADESPQSRQIQRSGERKTSESLTPSSRTKRSRTCSSIEFSTSRRTGGPESTPHQFAFQCLQQVLGVVFFDLDILVARHRKV